MIPDHVQQALVDPLLLQEWAVYSLNERPALIEERFGIQVSKRTLQRFYAHMNVRYK